MVASFRVALAVSFFAAVLAGAARADRPPLQSDIDKCAQRAADLGGNSMLGKVRLQLMIRRDGKVYAAYVHSEKGIEDKNLEHCLCSQATLWQLPAVEVDYARAWQPSFVPGGADNGGSSNAVGAHSGSTAPEAHLPSFDDPVEPAELNLRVAQATLDVADFATAAEAGQANLAVRKYPEAIALFKSALTRDANDTVALRGLAVALAESGGDTKEALAAADRLIALAPDSVVGHEAKVRVCLATQDDRCAFAEWKPTLKAKDTGPRSRLIAELQPAVQLAANRLKSATPAPGAAPAGAPAGAAGTTASTVASAAAPADPCAAEQGEDKQALCIVRRCLEGGTQEYAKELSQQNGVEYTPGDWRLKPVGKDKLLVTRPIEPKAGPSGQRHDAIWLVKLGDQFSIQPSTPEARQITLTHNACAANTQRR